MNIQAILDSIVAALQPMVALGFLPERQPEKERDFKKAILKPIVGVGYMGSQTPEINTMGSVAQERTLQWQVEVYNMNLYGPTGMHAQRDYVEQLLVGFRPPNCRPIYLVKDELMERMDNVFGHYYSFECKTMLVQTNYTDPSQVPIGTDAVPVLANVETYE